MIIVIGHSLKKDGGWTAILDSLWLSYPCRAKTHCRCAIGPQGGCWKRSDWMAVGRERGILVSSAVMSFEQGVALQPLGHAGLPGLSEPGN